MKYHINTIPIWDAVKLESECPLCVIERHLELQEAEKFLGASVMDPDTRIRVNDKGFCCKHYQILANGSNKLGLALILESHVNHIKPKILENLKEASDTLSGKKLLAFGKNIQLGEKLRATTENIDEHYKSCILCESLEGHMKRYAIAFLELWKNEQSFKEHFAKSKGVCLPHISLLLNMSMKHFSGNEAKEFCDILYKLTEENISRQEEEIKLFIKKFDYRFGDLPWGNSKDSAERMINRLESWCVGIEPHPEDRNKDKKY